MRLCAAFNAGPSKECMFLWVDNSGKETWKDRQTVDAMPESLPESLNVSMVAENCHSEILIFSGYFSLLCCYFYYFIFILFNFCFLFNFFYFKIQIKLKVK